MIAGAPGASIKRRYVAATVHAHFDDLASLILSRRGQVRAGAVSLVSLDRHDERLGAHLDGVALSLRSAGIDLLREVEQGSSIFARIACADAGSIGAEIDALLPVLLASPAQMRFAVDATRWSPFALNGHDATRTDRRAQSAVRVLLLNAATSSLTSSDAAHGWHDSRDWHEDSDPSVRRLSLYAFAASGRLAMKDVANEMASDPNESARRAAIRAATILGDRGASVERLIDPSRIATGEGRADLLLGIRASTIERGRGVLESLSSQQGSERAVVAGVGAIGDSFYVPWLVKRMTDARLTRLAGESFSMITGLDLALLDLERKPPEDFESGPNDDPEDDDVAMDPDEGLPWPDPLKVAAWWKENESRFPAGQRFFMGAPPSMEHCLRVLKSGYQRQRIAAAIWRCILEPGTALFPTDAPAWRQRRWLAQMEA